MSHVPVVIWPSLLVFVEQFLFRWCHQPALSSAKHGCSVGTQTEPQSINSTSFFNAATLTSDSADHRERYEVDQGFSLINSLQHFESFDEGHIIPTVHAMSFTFSGNLCRVGSLCSGRRQRLCPAGHWSIQISWRLHDGAICD